MKLSIPQIAQMSRLLDEALPLDTGGRRLWLDQLSPEYQDLAPALRNALLAGDSAEGFRELMTLPKLAFAGGAGSPETGLQPGLRVGPYELIRPLGAGGMAEVWLARRADGAFKRDVALKLMAAAQAHLEQRFARERDILASLEHPLIARFYDAGIDSSGLPYFAMEYVRGERLTAWCDSHRLGVRERLGLVLQVLDALQYAHSHQVIHRDIKPSNILVNESGQVRLLDFGVAKLLAPDEQQSPLTIVYGRGLTPEYASPELARGDSVEPATDVYALGVVMYELLTGCLPYRVQSRGSVALLEESIVAAQITNPSLHLAPDAGASRAVTQEKLERQLHGDLDAIILKALAKEPSDRYASAVALASDLECYLNGQPVQARPDHLSYRLAKLVRRHPAEWAGAAAALLVTGVLSYWLIRSPHPTPVAATATPASAALLQPPLDKSIAVLPFLDMSEKKDQEYFSDGLSEELIDHLVHSTDLKVIARTSSFQFKGRNEDVRSIARKLGVTHVLEGSVRKAGQQLRITAQLIRASDGAHLWSQTYDRNLFDIFEVQDEIGAQVTQALDVALRVGHRAADQEPNIQAYNLVLEANYLKARRTLRDVRRAAQLYRQALDIKPTYALAWARLAGAYLSEEILQGRPSPEQSQLVLAALNRAIRLDPDLTWAYYTRAGFEMNVTWDWLAAQADTQRMQAIDPRFDLLPSAFGDIALTFGEIDKAVQLYQHDIERNPLDPNTLDSLGLALCAADRLEQCLQSRLRLLQLHPEFDGVNSSVGIVHLYLGQFPAALTAMQQEPNEAYKLAGLAMIYAAMGKRAESDAALTSLTEEFASSNAYGIAEVYAYRGESDAAFDWLDRAYKQHHAAMAGLKADPLLRNLHADRRFQALLARMKLTSREPRFFQSEPAGTTTWQRRNPPPERHAANAKHLASQKQLACAKDPPGARGQGSTRYWRSCAS